MDYEQEVIEVFGEKKKILEDQISRLEQGKGFTLPGVSREKQIATWEKEIRKCEAFIIRAKNKQNEQSIKRLRTRFKLTNDMVEDMEAQGYTVREEGSIFIISTPYVDYKFHAASGTCLGIEV